MLTELVPHSHPTLTGVLAENDEMALGAIKALGDRAGTNVHVIGFDGTPDARIVPGRAREHRTGVYGSRAMRSAIGCRS